MLRHGTLRGIDTQNAPTVTTSRATIAAAAIASRFISIRVRSVGPVVNDKLDEATLDVLPAESPAKATDSGCALKTVSSLEKDTKRSAAHRTLKRR